MIDPAEVMRVVDEASAAFEATLTDEGRRAREQRNRDDVSSSLVYTTDQRDEALDEFEILGAAEALEVLAHQIRAECDRRMEAAYRAALRAFYVAEELSRDPAHADLIPQVAAMRAAHEAQYGRPIPPKAGE